MPSCSNCNQSDGITYTCSYCNEKYCSTHRLPEKHNCPSLKNDDEIKSPSLKSSSSDTGRNEESRLPFDVSLPTINTSATYLLLGLIWAVFVGQILIISAFGQDVAEMLFVLNSENPHYIWTWVTSIFAHGGLTHIIINSIVLFFFGTLVEEKLGKRKFIAFFLITGIIAGLTQIAVSTIANPNVVSGVVGASGAIAAILGYLTAIRPKLTVHLYFLLPVPLWAVTGFFAAYSIGFILFAGIGVGQIAHTAHLSGLIVGLLYGRYAYSQDVTIPEEYQV